MIPCFNHEDLSGDNLRLKKVLQKLLPSAVDWNKMHLIKRVLGSHLTLQLILLFNISVWLKIHAASQNQLMLE